MSDSPNVEYFGAFRKVLIAALSVYAERTQGGTTEVDERFGPYITPSRMRQIVATNDNYSRSPFQATPNELLASIKHLEERSKNGEGILAIDSVASIFHLNTFEKYYVMASAICSIDDTVARFATLLNDSIRSRVLRLATVADLLGVDRTDKTVLLALEKHSKLSKYVLVDDVQGSSLNDLSGVVPRSVIQFLRGRRSIDSMLDLNCELAPLTPLSQSGDVRIGSVSFFVSSLSDNPVLSLAAILDESCEIFASRFALSCDIRYESPELLPKVISVALRDAALNKFPLLVGPIVRGSEAKTVFEVTKGLRTNVFMWGPEPWNFDWIGGVSPSLIGGADSRRGGVPTRFVSLSRGRVLESQVRQLGGMRLSDREIVNIIDDFKAVEVEDRNAENNLVAVIKRRQDNSLESLSTKIVPVATMDDLVTDQRTSSMLQTFKVMVESRLDTFSESKIRIGGGRGVGISALFSGPSGTGKTMAAEVVAHETGLDLYIVNLAGIVDKYVGETEKNLKKIFDAAEKVQGILLFDEADSLFGRRGGGDGSNERYSNMEIAHLLQLMESFNGVAVLTTNLRSNLDDAFTRRIDVVIDFPALSSDVQREIWEKYLLGIGVLDAIDVDRLAKFDLSGGEIRNVVSTTAFLAKKNSAAISEREVFTAVAYEYRKSGRLCRREDFGEYFEFI